MLELLLCLKLQKFNFKLLQILQDSRHPRSASCGYGLHKDSVFKGSNVHAQVAKKIN